jgi:hypothetical protein
MLATEGVYDAEAYDAYEFAVGEVTEFVVRAPH